MSTQTLTMTLARRDRLLILGAVGALCLLSWVYLFRMAGMEMATVSWSVGYAWMTFAMWVVMMAAMMIPSATPMALIFAQVNRNRAHTGTPVIPTGLFFGGYLLAWAAFSLAATGLQWALHASALMSPVSLSVGPLAGGALFLLAGAYQWTPVKTACLRRCASPLDFLLGEWRDGFVGALVMGIRYGGYCIGCCALLMALLFAAGVMNLVWVAALAGVVLVEKLLPPGRWVHRVVGVVLLLVGAGMVMSGGGRHG